jgi:hypothetical protein
MKTHTGSCHCGAVAFTVTADIEKVMECNCSHCARKGFLLAFIPKEQFTLITGEDNLTEYRFNKKHIAHLFCKTCGVQCFGRGTSPDGKETIAINVRTLPDLDLATLTIEKFDGKSY